jgi:hypothetical protein
MFVGLRALVPISIFMGLPDFISNFIWNGSMRESL